MEGLYGIHNTPGTFEASFAAMAMFLISVGASL